MIDIKQIKEQQELVNKLLSEEEKYKDNEADYQDYIDEWNKLEDMIREYGGRLKYERDSKL